MNARNDTLLKVKTPDIFYIIIFPAQSVPAPNIQWELNKYKLMVTTITSLRQTHRLKNQVLSPYAF